MSKWEKNPIFTNCYCVQFVVFFFFYVRILKLEITKKRERCGEHSHLLRAYYVPQMPSISVSSLILQITLSPDPTFLPHCPATHCPNQNQGALRSFPSTGTPPLPPPHFLMTCLMVSSQIDLQASWQGLHPSVFVDCCIPPAPCMMGDSQTASPVFVNKEMTRRGSNTL